MRTLSLIIFVFFVSMSCTTPMNRDEFPDIEPSYHPDLATDEAGLWMQMDLVEKNLQSSGMLITDPALNEYVGGVVCRVAGSFCDDVRVYLVRLPYFNASMAPNGVMQIWTGLLLRAENEAQLAYVIGHELGHYLRRHSLQMWRDVRRKSSLFAYLSLGGFVLGAPGYAYDAGQLAMAGSVMKFSRDNEREADSVGFEQLVAGGYDPREAGKIWEALIKERNVSDDPSPWLFFSTHPPTLERIETLNKLAEESIRQGRAGAVGREDYQAALAPWRAPLLRDEMRQRRYARTQIILDRLFEDGNALGELYFFQGELYRLRNEDGDTTLAIGAYEKALDEGDAPIEVHRALGLLYLRSNEDERARLSLKRYLELNPDANDRAMVEDYLEEIP